jgi:uncharacterized protein (DUF2267 family)
MADPLILRLRELAPFRDERAAMRALEATVSALWLRLYPEEREKLAAYLPSPVAQRLRAPGPGLQPRPRPGFTADVARKEDVPAALAGEHVEVVCHALAELLPADARRWLAQRLPELARQFEPALRLQGPELEGEPHAISERFPLARRSRPVRRLRT